MTIDECFNALSDANRRYILSYLLGNGKAHEENRKYLIELFSVIFKKVV